MGRIEAMGIAEPLASQVRQAARRLESAGIGGDVVAALARLSLHQGPSIREVMAEIRLQDERSQRNHAFCSRASITMKPPIAPVLGDLNKT